MEGGGRRGIVTKRIQLPDADTDVDDNNAVIVVVWCGLLLLLLLLLLVHLTVMKCFMPHGVLKIEIIPLGSCSTIFTILCRVKHKQQQTTAMVASQ